MMVCGGGTEERNVNEGGNAIAVGSHELPLFTWMHVESNLPFSQWDVARDNQCLESRLIWEADGRDVKSCGGECIVARD